MAEYKHTLNLPHTTFPMKANLTQREPKRLEAWDASGIYSKMRQQAAGRKRFVLHDGPPYANGHLHCGHALNKILKDIIIKSKTLSGYDAPFKPGWDCHGLPIELNVEKKVGKAGVKVDANEFRRLCRTYATQQIAIQRDEFKRLGVFGDWASPYQTMNFSYEANIVRCLAAMLANGHVQQGFKPVHWCIDCGSALAEAEVDYDDKSSLSIDVAFYVLNPAEFLAKINNNLAIKPVIVPIWTTTPWTLPANEAVCLHPTLDYCVLDTGATYLLLAKDLVESALSRYSFSSSRPLIEVKGHIFEHLQLKHPLFDKEVPIVLGEHVTTDAGTGCVHTAPAHGPEDYLIGQAYQLPLINPVLANGCYADDVPLYAGLSILKANAPIIEALQDKNVLLHQTTIQHSYPHCWRHKTPVIFRATPQWFIAMDKNNLREQLLTAIPEVKWLPSWGEARIRLMIEKRPDWCISRQRAWGTPIPLFLHKTTRKPHPRSMEWLEEIACRIEEKGIEAWFDLDIEEMLGDEAGNYEKSTDTLDVWFDSGVSHYSVLTQDDSLAYPADLYLEGSDQHRGWFNSSLTTAVAMGKAAPYKTVLTHGYTVDAEGKKLSKSKGNYVALEQLVKEHGADILRLWVASTDYRHEVSISAEIIKRNTDAYRRIRNTARFLLANLFDFDYAAHEVKADALVAIDAWAIVRCQQLQDEIITAYEHYQFHVIYQKIHHFCAIDMGSFYLDIIKDRQYTTPVNSLARRSCQTAMYHIIQALTRWLAPILSFTAEEIWEAIPGNGGESVFLNQWYAFNASYQSVDMSYWQALQTIRDEVNKSLESARQAGLIGSGLAADVTIYASPQAKAQLDSLGEELRFFFITSSVNVQPVEACPSHLSIDEEVGVAVVIEPSSFAKCERCWHRCTSVGEDETHATLCKRCIDNISGGEEVRQFV